MKIGGCMVGYLQFMPFSLLLFCIYEVIKRYGYLQSMLSSIGLGPYIYFVFCSQSSSLVFRITVSLSEECNRINPNVLVLFCRVVQLSGFISRRRLWRGLYGRLRGLWWLPAGLHARLQCAAHAEACLANQLSLPAPR